MHSYYFEETLWGQYVDPNLYNKRLRARRTEKNELNSRWEITQTCILLIFLVQILNWIRAKSYKTNQFTLNSIRNPASCKVCHKNVMFSDDKGNTSRVYLRGNMISHWAMQTHYKSANDSFKTFNDSAGQSSRMVTDTDCCVPTYQTPDLSSGAGVWPGFNIQESCACKLAAMTGHCLGHHLSTRQQANKQKWASKVKGLQYN